MSSDNAERLRGSLRRSSTIDQWILLSKLLPRPLRSLSRDWSSRHVASLCIDRQSCRH